MAEGRKDAALAAIEAALHGYPDPRFRARLRGSLERSIRMTTTVAATNLIPYVMTHDIEPLIAFVKNVFGAEEVYRGTGSGGGIHCELRIGDTKLFFGGATPREPVKPRLLGLHVYVDDVDAVYQRALEGGATPLGEPRDAHYGERAGYVRDMAGNHWYIATHTGPSYFKQEPATVTPNLHFRYTPGGGAAAFIAFAKTAFGAEEEVHVADGDRVRHAVVRIHGAALELGESEEQYFDAPAAFILNVEELDAAYEQALAAGAEPLFPPAKQAFGGRMAGVTDPWANEWYLAAP